YHYHPVLPSFPTRRSSDLVQIHALFSGAAIDLTDYLHDLNYPGKLMAPERALTNFHRPHHNASPAGESVRHRYHRSYRSALWLRIHVYAAGLPAADSAAQPVHARGFSDVSAAALRAAPAEDQVARARTRAAIVMRRG